MNAAWRLLAGVLRRIRAMYWRMISRGYASQYILSPTFRMKGHVIQLYGDGRIELGADGANQIWGGVPARFIRDKPALPVRV